MIRALPCSFQAESTSARVCGSVSWLRPGWDAIGNWPSSFRSERVECACIVCMLLQHVEMVKPPADRFLLAHLHVAPRKQRDCTCCTSVAKRWPTVADSVRQSIHNLLTAPRRWRAMQCRAPAVLQLGFRIGPLAQSTTKSSCPAEVRRCLSSSRSSSRKLTMASRGAAASAAAATAQRDHHVSAARMPLDGFLQRVAECNCSAAEISRLVPFVIDSDTGEARTLGRLTPG